MNLSRRSFLGGALLIVGAVSAVARPRIVGDGIHDDADGLNALIAGDPVNIETSGVRILERGKIELNGGRFLIGTPLTFTGFSTCSINNAEIIASSAFASNAMIIIAGNCRNFILSNLTLDSGRWAATNSDWLIRVN